MESCWLCKKSFPSSDLTAVVDGYDKGAVKMMCDPCIKKFTSGKTTMTFEREKKAKAWWQLWR